MCKNLQQCVVSADVRWMAVLGRRDLSTAQTYVRNDGWTGFAWHLDKSVHPWHQLSLHDSRRKRPNITDTCSGDINTSWLLFQVMTSGPLPHPSHTFPSISSFRPLTHQSHLIGLTPHLQLCLIICCFLPPSVRRSPPSSSCCSSSSVSLPWRAVVPSLELFIIFFKQREEKAYKYRETPASLKVTVSFSTFFPPSLTQSKNYWLF